MQLSKNLFLLFLGLFLPIGLFSQPDTLRILYNQQSGVEKIETGLHITEQMADNPAELLSFSLQLFEATQKISPKTMLHARVARAVGDAFFYTDSIGRSIDYLLQAVAFAEKQVPLDTLFLGSVCSDLGLNYLEIKDNKRAHHYLARAISNFEGIGNMIELADSKSNLAILFHTEGNYEEAIRLLQEVNNIDKKTGDQKKISSSLNNLGRMYIDWGKYETGLDYYIQSIELLDSVSDIRTLGIRYNNIGMVYQIMANHTEAMGWFKKAIDAELPYGNTPRMAVRYNNLGNSYMALKIRDQAKVNFEKTYEIFLAAGYLPQLSKVSGSLGQLYVNMGIPEKAESWLIKAKNYAEQAGTLPEQMISYRHLYEFYKSQGKYENSLNFYELFTQANDSIFNLNVSKQVEEMEAKYQNQQKQLEIDRLETENVFTLKEVAFKKRQRNFALFGVAFLLLVTLSLYYLLALLKKQKKQVDAQNAELDRLNKTLNRLFAILSHDLRNATASYQSLVKVIGHHLQKGSTEKLIPISAEMETNARNLSAMLEGLLQWSVTQLKGIVPKKENISLRKTVEKEVALVFADAQNKGNTITIDIDNDERLWCDPESFSIVVRNLLVNANKFTDQGIINVSSEQNDGMIRIAVSDTGCGMPASIANSLFTGDEGTIRTGTSGEKGTGLGLMLVKEHIEKNRGTIRVESEEGKGTKFILQFPSEQV